MKVYRFSSCGVTRNYGPTQSQADSFYGSKLKVRIIGSGIQKWTVPYTGLYMIEAAGAQGASSHAAVVGGKGAYLRSVFSLKKDCVLYIVVGQTGSSCSSVWGGSGGGGSFVVMENRSSSDILAPANEHVSPLLIAGGGGGSGDDNTQISNKNGFPGLSSTTQVEGGGVFLQEGSSGGAGYRSDDATGRAKSFLNGAIGSYDYILKYDSKGGFGGGGNGYDAGGGGGGYRGGNGGAAGSSSYGGTSFNNGKLLVAIDGKQEGSGLVIITYFSGLTVNTCKISFSFGISTAITIIPIILES